MHLLGLTASTVGAMSMFCRVAAWQLLPLLAAFSTHIDASPAASAGDSGGGVGVFEDDECASSEASEGPCALSMLQMRGRRKSVVDTVSREQSQVASALARASRFFEARSASLARDLTPNELRRYRARFLERCAGAAGASAGEASRGSALATVAVDASFAAAHRDPPPQGGGEAEDADLEHALREEAPVVTASFAEATRSKAKNWQAGVAEWAANLSVADARRLCGHIDDPTLERVPSGVLEDLGADDSIPEYFDSRNAWPKCRDVMSHVRDQGKCGSCWAHAAAGTMDGRLCISSDGLFSGPRAWISAAYFTSCYQLNTMFTGEVDGCHGGNPGTALQAASRNLFHNGGVPTGSARDNTCVPWFAKGSSLLHFSEQTMTAPPCPQECTSKYPYPRSLESDKFFPSGKVQVTENFWDLKRALVQGGPVPFAMTVYQDFMTYMGGYYERTSDDKMGDHAAVALGYERYNGKDYIIGLNSWGHMWGDGTGIFKIDIACCELSYFLPMIDGDQSALPLPGEDGVVVPPSSAGAGRADSQSQCPTTTTGVTCFFFPCSASLGPTNCKWGRCECQVGHCSVGGRCTPSGGS